MRGRVGERVPWTESHTPKVPSPRGADRVVHRGAADAR
jgi:hypothetical protein